MRSNEARREVSGWPRAGCCPKNANHRLGPWNLEPAEDRGSGWAPHCSPSLQHSQLGRRKLVFILVHKDTEERDFFFFEESQRPVVLSRLFAELILKTGEGGCQPPILRSPCVFSCKISPLNLKAAFAPGSPVPPCPASIPFVFSRV